MLDRETVETIQRMLKSEEFSQREIAKKIGVSRGTVSAISRGSRTVRFAGETEGADSPFEPGPPRRCPKCGCLVQMPCLACRIREMKAAEDRQGDWENSPFGGDYQAGRATSTSRQSRHDRFNPRGSRESRRRRRGGDDLQRIARD